MQNGAFHRTRFLRFFLQRRVDYDSAMCDYSETSSAVLLERYRAGDGLAADEIFYRYIERLTRLARGRLSPNFQARFDADDVVTSAYRSFFLAARDGRYSLQRSGDLWRLLAEITMHKLHRHVAHHTAQKRGVTNEFNDDTFLTRCVSDEPTPADAAELVEEIQTLYSTLGCQTRAVIERRLQGESHAEIADALGCSERTIRRVIREAREWLTARCDRMNDDG